MPKEEETCKKIDYLRERVCLAILENIIIAAEATLGEVYLAVLFILCGYVSLHVGSLKLSPENKGGLSGIIKLSSIILHLNCLSREQKIECSL